MIGINRQILALLAALASACARPDAPRIISQHEIPDDPGHLAGVAEVDITPPLHLSLFGHGPEGRIAAGVRLRLGCRVFVFANPSLMSGAVALVPCDLAAPSALLHARVAEKLALMGLPISADRLFIMATHTHAGPAHYFGARSYSGTFSSQAPGFDAKVLTFFVDQIAGGVADAFATLSPACLAWKQRALPGFTFNRSYVPFLANAEQEHAEDRSAAARAIQAETYLQEQSAPAKDEPAPAIGASSKPDCRASNTPCPTPAEEAVDPTLSVLAIYARTQAASCAGSKLKGVFAVYGMHPTGVPNTNDLYHGDVFGFAVRTAAGSLSEPAPSGSKVDGAIAGERSRESASPDGARVVVGLANGIEGDVSPKVVFQSFPEARRLGTLLGQAIAEVSKSIDDTAKLHSSVLRHGAWSLTFPKGRYDDDPNHGLCERAELGMAAAGGARDGPTRLRAIPEANAGFQPDRPSPCHEQKLPLRSGIQSDDYYPRVAPIGLVQIGGGFVVTLPGEVTTTTGERIRNAVRARLAAREDLYGKQPPVVLIGLTNEYLQYFATAEEYAFQYYEGASTLYGPNSAQFLVRNVGCLAEQLVSGSNSCARVGNVSIERGRMGAPSPAANRWPPAEEFQASSIAPLQVVKKRRDGEFGWEMLIDALPLDFTSKPANFSVRVLAGEDGENVVDDDNGASLEIRELDDVKWRIRWIPDRRKDDSRCDRTFRLAVRGRVRWVSKPFVLDCARRTGGAGQ
ncbi:MAG TPA: neutral/alkaline non-lysosomal ceramidase N-terminal domain-containing protein [Lacunisphaera sp.]|nr:neutral/alkaline non-lysosomal ceramidase N-terminal domain-containing protein [Lacunisphaera sp.]